MTIKFYQNSSEPIAVDKALLELIEVEGALRESSSIVDPILNVSDLYDYVGSINYAYIEEFDRYYFVKNITSVRENLWRMSLHVDVLYTYRDSIRNNSAIIERNQNYYDLLLNDGLFQTQQEPKIWQVKFPGGFTRTDFVLAVAGN